MLRPGMATPQPVRGTQSLLGEDVDRFHAVVAAFDRVRRLYGFKRVEVPVFEPTAVFARTIGETTDVVSKEMYTFEDRGGESITLRPEFTAGICRAYLSEGWQQYRAAEARDARPGLPLRAAAEGPLPPVPPARRRDHRRRRAAADVELLSLRRPAATELGIHDGVTLQLNTLGDAETRDAWRAALVELFPGAPRFAVGGQPRPARAQSAAHPRQQGPAATGRLSTPRRRSTIF